MFAEKIIEKFRDSTLSSLQTSASKAFDTAENGPSKAWASNTPTSPPDSPGVKYKHLCVRVRRIEWGAVSRTGPPRLKKNSGADPEPRPRLCVF